MKKMKVTKRDKDYNWKKPQKSGRNEERKKKSFWRCGLSKREGERDRVWGEIRGRKKKMRKGNVQVNQSVGRGGGWGGKKGSQVGQGDSFYRVSGITAIRIPRWGGGG